MMNKCPICGSELIETSYGGPKGIEESWTKCTVCPFKIGEAYGIGEVVVGNIGFNYRCFTEEVRDEINTLIQKEIALVEELHLP